MSVLAQKAKINWLKNGDVNSKLFHRAINLRRRKNGVIGLEVDGDWIEDPRRLKEFVCKHFR